MLNVLVTGSNGQLGSEIRELAGNYPFQFYFTTRNELDIVDINYLKYFIIKNKIEVIINCAAYTLVDKAEEEEKLANEVNGFAVRNLAILSKEFQIKLIHISTDYVFNGINYKPYLETDPVEPCSAYGRSKSRGEKAILECEVKNSVIIRTSWVYSYYGKNFLKTILQLAKERAYLEVVFDQIGAPTYAKDLALVILEMIPKIENEKAEIYHYSNEGVLSWFDFAKEIVEMTKLDCEILPIESFRYPTLAKRPYYSLLNKDKIKTTLGIQIPYWRDGVSDCLKRLGERR